MKLSNKIFRPNSGLVATILGVLVALYLAVMLGQTIKRNYMLDRQISSLQQEIETLQAQKDQLNFNLQYYQTDSFAEREARAKLGLQKPGENVIIIPPKATPSANTTTLNTKPHLSNFKQWLNFLFGLN